MRSAERGHGRLLGFALLTFGVIAIGGLARSADASPEFLVIRGITITNVTDTSFSVNWVTDQPLPGSGSVDYGTSSTSLVFQTAELTPVPGARGDVHSVSVRSLSPATSYFFSIVDAGVTDPASGYVYKATTGPTLQSVSTNRSATGQVFQSDGKTSAPGVLVTVRILDNANLNGPSPTTSAPLSTFTNSQGYWSITLNPRTADNSNIFSFATTGPDFLLVTAEGGALGVVYPAQSTPIKLDSNGTMTASPMTLGAGVNPAETPVSSQTTATATATPTGTAMASPTETAPANQLGLTTPTSAVEKKPASGEASSTSTSTRTPVVIPTVAIPTRVLPPSQLTPAPLPPTPFPSSAVGRLPPTAVPALPRAVPPATGGPPSATPPLVAGAIPTGLAGALTPARLTPSPAASATATPVTPSIPAGGHTGATGAGPLQSLPLVVAGGLGLVGLGLAISMVGFVDQRRDG